MLFQHMNIVENQFGLLIYKREGEWFRLMIILNFQCTETVAYLAALFVI
jgi:hypothetical protein